MTTVTREISGAYLKLQKAAERHARAVVSPKQSLQDFRDAQADLVSVLRRDEVADLLISAYAGATDRTEFEDVSSLLDNLMNGDHLETEVKLSTRNGLKRSDVEKILEEIKRESKGKEIKFEKIDLVKIIDDFNARCNEFVTMISVSRTLDKKIKHRVKIAAKRIVTVSSFGVVCAIINAPLAIPTMGLVPTLSLGVAASSAVLAVQYSADWLNENGDGDGN